MKLISIITPCFNEEDNVVQIYEAVKNIFINYSHYHYEHIFIDNASTDSTLIKLKTLAKNDKKVKIIVNARNFGWIRSPFYALLQATGDAVINIASDFQDPPMLIPNFIQ